jgi:hypothetical protein
LEATSVLETLILHYVAIDLEHAVHFMDGLAACKTVTRLDLHSCKFVTPEAAQQLIAFIQAQANRGPSMLRELRIESYHIFTSAEGTFNGSPLAQVIPAMLNGSALESFHMCGICGEYDARQLLDTVRQNGSLVEVVLNQGRSGLSIFNDDEASRVATYCERNAKLPPLLVERCKSSLNESKSNAAIVPLLFAVTQRQAREVTLKTILIGVLDNACIGPDTFSSKRRFS